MGKIVRYTDPKSKHIRKFNYFRAYYKDTLLPIEGFISFFGSEMFDGYTDVNSMTRKQIYKHGYVKIKKYGDNWLEINNWKYMSQTLCYVSRDECKRLGYIRTQDELLLNPYIPDDFSPEIKRVTNENLLGQQIIQMNENQGQQIIQMNENQVATSRQRYSDQWITRWENTQPLTYFDIVENSNTTTTQQAPEDERYTSHEEHLDAHTGGTATPDTNTEGTNRT